MTDININKWFEFSMLTLFVFLCGVSTLNFPVNYENIDGWYLSYTRVFGPIESTFNSPPIGLPAYFYGAVHLLGRLLGLEPTQEFYLATLLQAAGMCLGGLALYGAAKRLGASPLVAVSTLGTALYFFAQRFTHSFWSESTVLIALCIMLWLLVRLTQSLLSPNARLSAPQLVVFCLCFALITVTRYGLILVILPGVALITWEARHTPNFRRFWGSLLGTIALAWVGSAGANVLRYGKFELAGTDGSRLWALVRPDADTLLADSDLYALLKAEVPGFDQLNEWNLDRAQIRSVTGFHVWEVTRELASEALSKDPGFLVRRAIPEWRPFLLTLGDPIYGLWVPDPHSPTFLPPILQPSETWNRGSSTLVTLANRLHPIFLALAICLGVSIWIALSPVPRADSFRLTKPALCLLAPWGIGATLFAASQVPVSVYVFCGAVGAALSFLKLDSAGEFSKQIRQLHRLSTFMHFAALSLLLYSCAVVTMGRPLPRYLILVLPLLSLWLVAALQAAFVVFQIVYRQAHWPQRTRRLTIAAVPPTTHL